MAADRRVRCEDVVDMFIDSESELEMLEESSGML